MTKMKAKGELKVAFARGPGGGWPRNLICDEGIPKDTLRHVRSIGQAEVMLELSVAHRGFEGKLGYNSGEQKIPHFTVEQERMRCLTTRMV